MSENYPYYMLRYRPMALAQHNPEWMKSKGPVHRPDVTWEIRPDWVVEHNPEWVATNAFLKCRGE